MKSLKIISLLLIAGILVVTGCDDDEKEQGISVQVSGSLEGIALSSWYKEDAIGLYVHKTDPSQSAGSYTHHKYKATQNGKTTDFEPWEEKETAYYLTNESLIGLIAYYPYNPDTRDLVVPINVSNQSNLRDINFSVTKLTPVNYNNNPKFNLTFEQQLSLITVTIGVDQNFKDINNESPKVLLCDVPVTAKYNLIDQEITYTEADKGSFDLERNVTSVTVGGMVIPIEAGSGASFEVQFGNNKYNVPFPQNTALGKGKSTHFDIDFKMVDGEVSIRVVATPQQ